MEEGVAKQAVEFPQVMASVTTMSYTEIQSSDYTSPLFICPFSLIFFYLERI